jgi:hypothetical protein
LGKPLQKGRWSRFAEIGGSTVARIVVVEDDPIVQMTMRRVLQQRPDLPVTTSAPPRTPGAAPPPDDLAMTTRRGAIRSLPKPSRPSFLPAMTGRFTAMTPPPALSRPDHNAVPNS